MLPWKFTMTEKQKDLKEKAHKFIKDEIEPKADKLAEYEAAEGLDFGPYGEAVKKAYESGAAERLMHETVQKANDYGLTGITIPEKYGGRGGTLLDNIIANDEAYMAVTEVLLNRAKPYSQIYTTYLGLSPFLTFYQSCGPGASLIAGSYLNEEKKKELLPKIVKGELTASLAMTEPNAGSDVFNLETIAKEEGDHYLVNGTKRFITMTNIDDYLSMFVRFDPPKLPRSRGVGCLLIDRKTLGIRFKENPPTIGLQYLTHPFVIFENVRVPKENVLFPIGHLVEQMTMFNRERLANCLGDIFIAQTAFEFAKKHALNRRQFGTEVINSQVMQHYLADMATKIMAGRALVYHCGSNAVDDLYPDGLLVSIAKNYTTEMAVEVTSRALRMGGGDGTRMDFPMEGLWREAMQTTITGGTNEMLRDEIAQWIVPEKRLARLRDTAKALG